MPSVGSMPCPQRRGPVPLSRIFPRTPDQSRLSPPLSNRRRAFAAQAVGNEGLSPLQGRECGSAVRLVPPGAFLADHGRMDPLPEEPRGGDDGVPPTTATIPWIASGSVAPRPPRKARASTGFWCWKQPPRRVLGEGDGHELTLKPLSPGSAARSAGSRRLRNRPPRSRYRSGRAP